MTLQTDRQVIDLFNIKKNDRILDVGGSMKQHELINIDTLVDIIRPEEAPYKASKLLAKRFLRVDVTNDKLPFKDNEFDVCLCTHTLEDLCNPIKIMNEMSRVAKKGLIVTPTMGHDLVFLKYDVTNWLVGARRVPGLAHHKWFFVKEKGGLRVIPKNYSLLYSWNYHVTSWLGKKEMVYPWKGEIKYKVINGLSIHELIEEYRKYLSKNSKLIRKGRVLFFVDNPINVVKAYVKLILKRGKGYQYGRKIHK